MGGQGWGERDRVCVCVCVFGETTDFVLVCRFFCPARALHYCAVSVAQRSVLASAAPYYAICSASLIDTAPAHRQQCSVCLLPFQLLLVAVVLLFRSSPSHRTSEIRSCVKVEVAVLAPSPSLIDLTVSVDVKQH